ncbi:MAG: hypothetical protein J6V09_01070 [Clostridia bacterium]|nr:hypothetical protein [Clostridia bacterium]
MFSGIMSFLDSVKEARFDFKVISDAIAKLYHNIANDASVLEIVNSIMDTIRPLYGSIMTVLVILSVLIALFGHKAMAVIKFVFFFVIGFFLGTHLLAPLIPPEVAIPPIIVGLIVGFVAAVLYRFLYVLLYSVAFGYGTYVLLYNGSIIHEEMVYNLGKSAICLICAIVVVVVALIFKKFIEMVGTAFLGGWLAVKLFDLTLLPYSGGNIVAIMIPAVIIAAIGAVVQIRTRRRY